MYEAEDKKSVMYALAVSRSNTFFCADSRGVVAGVDLRTGTKVSRCGKCAQKAPYLFDVILSSFAGHNDLVTCLDLSPDGSEASLHCVICWLFISSRIGKLLSGGIDRVVRIWDIKDASEVLFCA